MSPEGIEGPGFTPQPPETPGHSGEVTPSNHAGDSGGSYRFLFYNKAKKKKTDEQQKDSSDSEQTKTDENDNAVQLKLSDQARKALEIKRSKGNQN